MIKNPDKLYIALPDGHLMNHVLPFLTKTGLVFQGYDKSNLNKRPVLFLESDFSKKIITHVSKVATKVIRPQDMPTHVANSNFDLAISGQDWLKEHKLRFPNSPLIEILPLGFGAVKIVAAVHKDMWQEKISKYTKTLREKIHGQYIKIASEYVYIADNYAIEKNLSPYRIIMTYGATESLIPEDCNMIIENTETGNTLRKNNLKIIDIVMTSEACLIASKESMKISWKREIIEGFQKIFKNALNLQD